MGRRVYGKYGHPLDKSGPLARSIESPACARIELHERGGGAAGNGVTAAALTRLPRSRPCPVSAPLASSLVLRFPSLPSSLAPCLPRPPLHYLLPRHLSFRSFSLPDIIPVVSPMPRFPSLLSFPAPYLPHRALPRPPPLSSPGVKGRSLVLKIIGARPSPLAPSKL